MEMNLLLVVELGGAAIDVAENFLKSLEFGINSDEPTGGADTLDVNLALTITAVSAFEGTATTEAATRPITEENDPVEVIGLAEGAEFTVSARDLEGTSTVTIIGPDSVAILSTIMVTVNGGGDDSGITFPPSEINPATFVVPTAADSNVTETLTLSGDVTPEGAFTLSISQSNAELAEANLITTLSFSDGNGSTVTRIITIRIVKGVLKFRIKVFLDGAAQGE